MLVLPVGVVGQDPREDGELHEVVVGSSGHLVQVHQVVEVGDGATLPILGGPAPLLRLGQVDPQAVGHLAQPLQEREAALEGAEHKEPGEAY